GIEMARDRGRRRVVERGERGAIARRRLRLLGRHRIVQRQLLGPRAQMRGDDSARVARGSGLGEGPHHVGLAQRAQRLERDELRVARPDADADQAAGHSPALASALTAAAVMALPPMRPRTIRYGTPCRLAASASFDSAAPTKPTGMPRIAAGFGAPASSTSIRRNSAVGALPIATTLPASFWPHSSSAPPDRV